MSLQVRQVNEEVYTCNQCGKDYSIRDAIITKGNTYFCGMKCVMDYDQQNVSSYFSPKEET